MTAPTDKEAREKLFARVRAMQVEPSAMPNTRQHTHSGGVDFSTLQGFDEIRMQREIAARLGIDNPYFRMHEGRSGARAEIAGRTFLNFASYDYLGLNGHPEIVAAAKDAIDRYGISASGSRHVSGERPVHRELEHALSAHYGVDDCMTLVSGYATNLGVIGQMLTSKDAIFYDSAIHNSVAMGGMLSGAARRSFHHNDLDHLEEILAAHRGSYDHALIVVEGVYSMDGDYPDLPRLIDIKARSRAWLMVDEAHALGVIGKRGYGIAEHFGTDTKDVEIWMGTLSKTLCACGGYIAGAAELVDYLKNATGAFVYSVAIPPVIAVTALKTLEIFHNEPERVTKLQQNSTAFLNGARKRGLDTGSGRGTAVAPIMMHDSLPAAILSQKLHDRGIEVKPVLYPGVPAKASRLRFFLSAAHSDEDINMALDATAEEWKLVGEHIKSLTG
jgi:8-amino-7-oxononanoate synthase